MADEEKKRKAREYMREYYKNNAEYRAKRKAASRQYYEKVRGTSRDKYWRKRYRDKMASLGPEEMAEYRRKRNEAAIKWQRKNKDKTDAYRKQRTGKRLEWYNRIKADRGCKDCGVKDWRCLQFHHRNPEEKEFTLAQARGHNQARIEAEIEKCDVLCANCHAIHHWKEKGF